MMALGFTSYALDRDRDWPLVTLPDFAVKAATFRDLTGAFFVGVVPIVTDETRRLWEQYSVQNSEWIAESLAFENETASIYGSARRNLQQEESVPDLSNGFSSTIFEIETVRKDGVLLRFPQIEDSPGPLFPMWQNSPTVSALVNFNMGSETDFQEDMQACLDSQQAILSRGTQLQGNPFFSENVLQIWEANSGANTGDPSSAFFFPVFDTYHQNRNMVGIVAAVTYWSIFFEDILPEEARGIFVLVENECGQNYTYQVNGPQATFYGAGDLHDSRYNYLEVSATIDVERRGTPLKTDYCPYTIKIYASDETRSIYTTFRPGVYTLIVIIIFLFAFLIFIAYDILVEKRQRRVLKSAQQDRAVVASLFPPAIRDRLFNNSIPDEAVKKPGRMGVAASMPIEGGPGAHAGGDEDIQRPLNGPLGSESAPARIKNFLNENVDETTKKDEKPIADLFPNTTVLFADIAGFTAWSSQREPAQVFTLLQTIYQAFDKLAKKLGVFKIETIGDCYVAVTGLPDPQDDHAVRMARFAREIGFRMQDVVRRLEVTLGPGTGELCMRTGLHSGPVTAGVLRGEKSRFQLFGDTVNTAARMESTGVKHQIQCSTTTAELLQGGGKGYWLTKREDVVIAKGKGEMQTFWIATRSKNSLTTSEHRGANSIRSSDHSSVKASSESTVQGFSDTRLESSRVASEMSLRTEEESSSSEEDNSTRKPRVATIARQVVRSTSSKQNRPTEDRMQRLIDWHVDMLGRLLQAIVAQRKATSHEEASSNLPDWKWSGRHVADEVADFISFPKVDPNLNSLETFAATIELGPEVRQQLRDFISKIASMYRSNAFHNFEHACHVTMCTNKLFNRKFSSSLPLLLVSCPYLFHPPPQVLWFSLMRIRKKKWRRSRTQPRSTPIP
jgi:class 3 adenylate cyclase